MRTDPRVSSPLLSTLRWMVVPLVLAALPVSVDRPADPVLHVTLAITDPGYATEQWLAMLRRRLAEGSYDSVSRIRSPITGAEAAWVALIQSRLTAWEDELPALAQPFEPVAAPRKVSIVLGNRGAHDAFTHDAVTIGFDLAALVAEYGEATRVENGQRIDRLFRHEYVHLLQKVWLIEHPYDARSPLELAIAEIWSEGMGNYYSMSERWRATSGRHSTVATATLDELEPRFAARIAALACATPERAAELTKDLSWGRFDRKWGALTPALWLEAEMSTSDRALREFVVAGPEGVWDLADRHLPTTLGVVVREARNAATLCGQS
jgi:hypothetical protein